MAIHDLSGMLLILKGRPLDPKDVARARNLTFVRRIGNSHWDEYRYRSYTPLRNEQQLQLEGPYTYTVLFRCADDRMLVVGEASAVVAALVQGELAEVFAVDLYNVHIDIHALVRRVASGKMPDGKDIPYTLTFVHARTPGLKQTVRAISFWGADLPSANIFANNLGLLNCTNCGLKTKDAETELVRLSSSGIVYFSGLS